MRPQTTSACFRSTASVHLTSYSRPPPRLVNPSPLLPNLSPKIQSRTFFDSLLTSTLGSTTLRHLTHSQTLSHPSALLFKTVSDIEKYPNFLPFTISSTVTSHDDRGLPSRARLKVGYDKFGLEEDWDSIVTCDPESGIVEAKSAEGSDTESLFEVLRTRWEIKPLSNTQGGTEAGSLAKLDLHVKFRNPVYDQMFAQVEGKVASAVIRAFEKRVRELDEKTK